MGDSTGDEDTHCVNTKEAVRFQLLCQWRYAQLALSTVSALTTSVAMVEGFESVAFGITAILALVVMYDAASVRRWVGRQSIFLNRIMREIRLRRPVAEWEHDLREFVGHTPFQVIIGGALGIIVAWLWFTIAP